MKSGPTGPVGGLFEKKRPACRAGGGQASPPYIILSMTHHQLFYIICQVQARGPMFTGFVCHPSHKGFSDNYN